LGVASGLAASHGAGVIHRDVKPENIFLEHRPDGQERPRVLDFGSAFVVGDSPHVPLERITTRASVVGTPGYSSPEQAEGVLAHPSADVYALAVTLYEMLAGSPPYRGSSWLELLHLHATEPVPQLRFVSSDLGSVLVQAMAKRPDERFRSMEAFARALAAVPEARSR
jgi:serine/threonine-protein kinase